MKLQTDDIELLTEALSRWMDDWCLFAEEAIGVTLDDEQKAILHSVQHNRMTSVASGTARGKDFISAVAAVCFLYLMPGEMEDGKFESTKVALTAPTDRQILNIMMPEVAGIYKRLKANGIAPHGARLTAYNIRTDIEDIFLTGFKADEYNHEAWSGFHAVNTMFVVTEASGISESVYNAIEGNLQGNSRLLLVFNHNVPTGYAHNSQRSPRFHKFRLDSLNAPNVQQKKTVIPGQVDYEWVKDKVQTWCTPIAKSDYSQNEGDFLWEGTYYRPNDLFRIKVRGMAPKVASDVLVPQEWIEAAQARYKAHSAVRNEQIAIALSNSGVAVAMKPLRLGVDVAGMGRDSSAFCFRFGDFVREFRLIQSGGVANHMEIAGITKHEIQKHTNTFNGLYPSAFVDTVGEGAGVFSRLEEENVKNIYSVKGGEAAKEGTQPRKDATGEYTFKNMRAFLYWKVREWLNPDTSKAMLPPDMEFTGLTELKWNMQGDGTIELEKKDDLKKRLGRSPDYEDALAMTFYPVEDVDGRPHRQNQTANFYPF